MIPISINTSRGRKALTMLAAFTITATYAAAAVAAPQNADATDTASGANATQSANAAQSANIATSTGNSNETAETNKAESGNTVTGTNTVAAPTATDNSAASDAATAPDSAAAPAASDNSNAAAATNTDTDTETDRAASGGGINITNVETSGNFGDKFSVNSPVNIKISYEGKAVAKGAEFGIQLGDGLVLPPGFTGVPLKATSLSGEEKTIGQCTASGGNFKCTVTEDPKAALGGNGDLRNGFVKLEAVLDKTSTGKTETDIVVDGVTHKVELGKGVIGEPVTLDNGKFCSSSGMDGDLYAYWCWIQSKISGGGEVVITENRADASWQTGVSCVEANDTADWTKVPDNGKPKGKRDGQTLTYTAPAGGEWVCRTGVSVKTTEKVMTNEASVNGTLVSSTTKWRARGSSGADTDEDVIPPAPTPTPEPTPDQPKPPAPDVEKPPAPVPSEPPAPEPTPEPSTPPAPEQPKPPAPTPTPEPSTPPAPDTEKPPAPVPTPTPEPTPDQPKPPAPNTEKPPAPAPTPDQPKPPAPEQPKPPAPTPNTPPAPEKPKPTPEPSTPPAPEQPKPPVSVTPTPGKPNTPSKPSYDAPRLLAHTGTSADIVVGASTALAVAGGALLVARKRRQD